MKPAILVEQLSKRYRLGARQVGGYRTLRESLADACASPLRKLGGWLRGAGGGASTVDGDDLWALRDVSMEIAPGEVVGIIGGNGAGKSTFLKILSRITEPTEGRVELRGRVGSLLEVGTGFHPELTGRENVYLNGAILGMTRREIDRQFDAIVAFSEVERFLDTPVKRYSSGMYVRLAFAVAAHLNPEVLLVDEVLAVGDATYQRRCIQRMAALAESGMTVLFVSHNMDLIPRLCKKAVLLQAGRVAAVGPAGEVTAQYLANQLKEAQGGDLSGKTRTGNGRARFKSLRLVGPDGRPRVAHPSGDDLILRMEVAARENVPDAALAVVVQSMHGARIITSWTKEANYPVRLQPGVETFECRFNNVRLRPGHRVIINLWMSAEAVLDSVEHAMVVEVVDTDETQGLSTDPMQGLIVSDYRWSRSACVANEIGPNVPTALAN
jgi:lipopolysaccharide transport system ATP-binding protein